jgi:hypothetical protein
MLRASPKAIRLLVLCYACAFSESVCGQQFLATLLARLVNIQLVQGRRLSPSDTEDRD